MDSHQGRKWAERITKLMPGCIFFTGEEVSSVDSATFYIAPVPIGVFRAIGDGLFFFAAGRILDGSGASTSRVILEASDSISTHTLFDSDDITLTFFAGETEWRLWGELFYAGRSTFKGCFGMQSTDNAFFLPTKADYVEGTLEDETTLTFTLREEGSTDTVIAEYMKIDFIPGPITS